MYICQNIIKMAKIAKEKTIRSVMSAQPENYGSLGKRIEIGSKACVSKNKAGFKIEYFTPTIQVLIGIGKDHTAYLIMDEDAWKALKKDNKISIDTLNTFKKNFL